MLSQATGQTGRAFNTKASLASDKSKTTVAVKISRISLVSTQTNKSNQEINYWQVSK